MSSTKGRGSLFCFMSKDKEHKWGQTIASFSGLLCGSNFWTFTYDQISIIPCTSKQSH